MYKALAVTADQMPFYDDGVGATDNPIFKVVGGAFGTGLWLKIKEGYTKIAQVYEAGDEVYLFGFSRGAYTARSLAGMIAVAGLPTANFTNNVVDTAFRAYREKDNRQQILAQLKDFNMFNAKIRMIGVWDTVGALGIPSAIGQVDPIAYGFLDTGLHPDVLNAYQALAIDEKRCQFPPTLWDANTQPGQTLEQVWFCGVHSDVGGGEPIDDTEKSALSDITLAWMMDKASALGLDFNDDVLNLFALPLDPEWALDTLHTSWKVFNGFPVPRSIAKNSVIANSVRIRAEHDPTYRPSNLVFQNGQLAAGYGSADVMKEPAVQVAGAAT
jgi:uncharacterized protein (DUF2235 family)